MEGEYPGKVRTLLRQPWWWIVVLITIEVLCQHFSGDRHNDLQVSFRWRKHVCGDVLSFRAKPHITEVTFGKRQHLGGTKEEPATLGANTDLRSLSGGKTCHPKNPQMIRSAVDAFGGPSFGPAGDLGNSVL